MDKIYLEAYFADVNVHLKQMCNQAIIDTPFVKAGIMMNRINKILKNSIVTENKMVDIFNNKFQKYIGVKIINDVPYYTGKPLFLIRTLRNIFDNIVNNTDEINDLNKFFKKANLNKYFINEIQHLTFSKVNKDIETHSRRIFHLKTGEFHRYMTPPMGNNEFLQKMIYEDIMKLEE